MQVLNEKIESLVKDELNPDTDVHVMGILKANNFSRADFQRANIGTVILDEVHIAIDTCFTSVLPKELPLNFNFHLHE